MTQHGGTTMTERPKLTQKQDAIYQFIRNKIHTRGYGPTVREIGQEFGIRSPNGVMCHLQALVKKGLIRREANMSRAITLVDDSRGVPLKGTIAAGMPLETYEDVEHLDLSQLFHREGYFALQVRGDSMIEDHIQEGDFVVVKHQETAENGQIVVALVDAGETTLKRFYREKRRVRLEPANSTMKPIYAKQVDILGVVVGVVRQIG